MVLSKGDTAYVAVTVIKRMTLSCTLYDIHKSSFATVCVDSDDF